MKSTLAARLTGYTRAVPAPDRTVIGGAARDADLESARALIGRRIAALRKERGLSVRALAEAAGVTGGFISQTENGHTTPSVGTLIAIASALNARVGDFFEPLDHSGEVLHRGERTIY